MTQAGGLFVVGLGPGDRSAMTAEAAAVIGGADVVIGYAGYFDWLGDLATGKVCLASALGEEAARARLAVQHACDGRRVCVISSGDAGVYGMASLVFEVAAEAAGDVRPEVVVIPGVSAVNAGAAILGAPLGHDFAVISLSDLLTPWATIERRLRAAAEGDFVLALLNPRSQRRDWQLERARNILLAHRAPETPVGIVRNAYRPGQSASITTLAALTASAVDMFTTVFVGSTSTRCLGDRLVTPRGYAVSAAESQATPTLNAVLSAGLHPGEILAESFRIIEREVGAHRFGAAEWPVVRRMIHASGDLELPSSICLRNDPVAEGVRALRQGIPIVTDVSMVAAGINKRFLEASGTRLHCFIDDAAVRRQAEATGRTRSHWAMERAVAEIGEAIYIVGNAPTALLALCEAVRRRALPARLIVAMPVGFVAVEESKEAALALPVPVLAVRGRKGGSAVAAAAVNALLELAAEEKR